MIEYYKKYLLQSKKLEFFLDLIDRVNNKI